MSIRSIELQSQAPAKPRLGEPCNGCGICCAAEPCPVAMLFLGQGREASPCRALQWRAADSRYVCGMAIRPGEYLHWLPVFLEARAARWFAGRIAEGRGCDADIEVAED
jgi:hypothetical protein